MPPGGTEAGFYAFTGYNCQIVKCKGSYFFVNGKVTSTIFNMLTDPARNMQVHNYTGADSGAVCRFEAESCGVNMRLVCIIQ